jgi:plastocyanin
MKKLVVLLSLSLFALYALAEYYGAEEAVGAPEPEQIAAAEGVTITLEAVGLSAWTVTAVEGASPEEVGELSVENPTLSLEVGRRYHFDVSGVDSSYHPLDLRDAEGNVLLAQGAQEGAFAADEEVAFEANADAVVFTLSEALSEVIATYHCTVHPPMVGEIAVVAR